MDVGASNRNLGLLEGKPMLFMIEPPLQFLPEAFKHWTTTPAWTGLFFKEPGHCTMVPAQRGKSKDHSEHRERSRVRLREHVVW